MVVGLESPLTGIFRDRLMAGRLILGQVIEVQVLVSEQPHTLGDNAPKMSHTSIRLQTGQWVGRGVWG